MKLDDPPLRDAHRTIKSSSRYFGRSLSYGYGDSFYGESGCWVATGSREIGDSEMGRKLGAPRAEIWIIQVSVTWQREHCPIG
jgi:hypothetical protein